jgi:hypothetical protein
MESVRVGCRMFSWPEARASFGKISELKRSSLRKCFIHYSHVEPAG